MQWTLCLYPQARRDADDPAFSRSFENRLQEIIADFDAADTLIPDQQVAHADRAAGRLFQAISGFTSLVGQPSTRQLARFWFLNGEIKLALGDLQRAADALECCAGLIAQNPARDHIAVNFLRARVAGEMRFFSKSVEHYSAVIEQTELDVVQKRDFVTGDLASFRCFIYLQRAKYGMALGYFDGAQDDAHMATSILDRALILHGAPRPLKPHAGDNSAMHPAFIDYTRRIHALTAQGEPQVGSALGNWLELCLDVPSIYAAIEMWHTRLFMHERNANGLLASFYDLLCDCTKVGALVPLWADKIARLSYRAAQVAIIGYDVTYLLRHHASGATSSRAKHIWLRRADQSLASAFSARDADDATPTHDANLRFQVARYGLWLRQRKEHANDFPNVPDLIDIGTDVRDLLQHSIAQGKTFGAAMCSQLLGYVALALGDLVNADCCLHDAITLFEQAHGDVFYPRVEETRRTIACLDV